MKRSFSLRTRVAAATALGATIIVVALGILVALAINRNNLSQLDRRLETASDVLVPNAATAGLFLGALGDKGAFAITIRSAGGDTVLVSTPTRLPPLEPGWQSVDVNGTKYRAFTATTPFLGTRISLAVPYSEAQDVTTEQQRQVALVGVLAVAAASGLGWLFGGRAVRPLVDLTGRIVRRDPELTPASSGVREADELASAAESMLRDVAEAQDATTAALATARDFAAVSAHELRTPLTAMRTDLEVLTTHQLTSAQQNEIFRDLIRAQGRVESTLSDLERLARGELSTDQDFVDCDLVDICDLAADDAMRHHPGLQVTVDAVPLTVRGMPGGLRLTLDNAITNAVRHGGATAVRITLRAVDDATVITVDDNGSGVPDAERTQVFERFHRGTNATSSGSGLGLALVAQQAALHGGRAHFEDSPLGGARLVVELHSADAHPMPHLPAQNATSPASPR
ncbi:MULTISPECIES: sensor histidine kinase [Rhodococcus]|uniref:histidine kinase n=1 Tax=Rhodococcus oxybenzonivorans TaxID=1990687 RepID=A0AAE5A8N0_9NOCA|nr:MULTISPECIES: HAMP domain-containing sensor histidine kinase [Rhodococcus]MDV7240745.1 HAMP domain-containing sensor histidine kinase [Rhodococcus oxybenzonivorans]MDV7267907.1 HAMP domain-containing sensor histidine kinase [Rhodococcus oxybenzonivorans]MDV7273018.1 HAMP domain-containing sensor histidine kinase [Rhodococcus oxybenzonivorans]MDV7333244.1 HAMP domain-containing sensor histidine kinase [Rhodococcus oxybenzonivorans]MDV7342410.1 HAMP domain-containing sensor histidine kinase [